jgi:hypothetical protein
VLKQLPDCFRVAEWELAGGEHIPTLAVSPLPSPLIPVTLLLYSSSDCASSLVAHSYTHKPRPASLSAVLALLRVLCLLT